MINVVVTTIPYSPIVVEQTRSMHVLNPLQIQKVKALRYVLLYVTKANMIMEMGVLIPIMNSPMVITNEQLTNSVNLVRLLG